MEDTKKDNTQPGKVSFETTLGTIQIEGREDFVSKTMQTIVNQLTGTESTKSAKHTKKFDQKKATAKKGKIKKVFQPEYLPELFKKEQIEELTKFFHEKMPQSHQDSFLCVAYWLKKTQGLKDISANEVYTVYKTLNKRIPEHINQVFRDAKAARSFFGISADKDLHYFLTPLGEQHVELDLPKNTGPVNNGN